jgi:hypothetical protein
MSRAPVKMPEFMVDYDLKTARKGDRHWRKVQRRRAQFYALAKGIFSQAIIHSSDSCYGFENEAVARAFYNLTKLYARRCHFWKGRMLDSAEVEK